MQKSLFLIFLFLTLFIAKNSFALEKDLIAPEENYIIDEKEEIIAQDFMVVSGHYLASQAGYKILKKGGNAIDAVIAAQMVLNIVEPNASGIGGGGFLLYFDKKRNKTTFFNGRETAPINIDHKLFINKAGQPINFKNAIKGGKSVGVPGLLKMLFLAHQQYGKLPWFELFQDAIDVASLGFSLTPRIEYLANNTPHIKEFKNTRKMFVGKKSAEDEEIMIFNHKLANVFREIAENGIDDFYNGKIAQNIVQAVQKTKINPSNLTLSDLSSYKASTREPICSKYRKYKVCSAQLPSSGGITLLQILGILENFDLSQIEPNSAESTHIIAEATRIAFTDRNKYLADERFVAVPSLKLLNKKYLKTRSFLINVDATLLKVAPGEFSNGTSYYQKKNEPDSTTHISVIDKDGNAVSFTSSIEHSFGSGLMVDGFLLNNQLTDFSFVSHIDGLPVANRIEGGKMPRSSMTPTLVFNERNKLVLILGSPGGARIIPYVAKTIISVLDWNIPINEAVNFPNFSKISNVLELEEGTYFEDFKEKLENIGHNVNIRNLTSGINAIHITKKGIFSGTDSRRDGIALGE